MKAFYEAKHRDMYRAEQEQPNRDAPGSAGDTADHRSDAEPIGGQPTEAEVPPEGADDAPLAGTPSSGNQGYKVDDGGRNARRYRNTTRPPEVRPEFWQTMTPKQKQKAREDWESTTGRAIKKSFSLS